jgi:C1A family cysteine protease
MLTAARRARLPDWEKRGGWRPDFPDLRDFTPSHPAVSPLLDRLAVATTTPEEIPSAVDLREWCSPIENQGPTNSCTANAAVSLVEYFQRRAFGQHIDGSRLFLYKVSRNLLGWRGDSGAYIRTTMNALRLFGVPPESYWPFIIANLDVEPPGFCYALAQNYQALVYYRLDSPELTRQGLVDSVKVHLARGLPTMLGFTAFRTILLPELRGGIPLPAIGEAFFETHAVSAVGYDDSIRIQNPLPGGHVTMGAFLTRNSWGPFWGEGGYGWLPYEYVLRGLAQDFWVLIASEWVDTGAFD